MSKQGNGLLGHDAADTSLEEHRSPSGVSVLTDGSRGSSTARRPRGCAKWLVDPRRALHKHFALALLCFFVPGPYFMDSAAGAYKKAICASSSLDINSTTYSLLFALPSLSGVFTSPIGVIIMKWGDPRSAAAAGFLTFIAAVGTVLGLHLQNFAVTLVFRILFWLGLYCLIALQTTVSYKLYPKESLGIAMGFMITSCRVGGMGGYITSGYVLDFFNGDVVKALSCGVAVVGVALFACICFWRLRGGTGNREVLALLETARTAGQEEEISFERQVRGFSCRTWLVIAQVSLVYAAIFPFETIEADYFESDWGFDATTVGWFASFGPSFGFISWVFGICIRTVRAQVFCGCLAWGALVFAFVLLWTKQPSNPLLALGIFGFAYAYMSAALWALIPPSLGSRTECETAAATSCIVGFSATTALSNILVGALHDNFGYGAVCLWFVLISSVGLACSLVSLVLFCKHDTSDQGQELQAELTSSTSEEAQIQVHGIGSLPMIEEHFPREESNT